MSEEGKQLQVNQLDERAHKGRTQQLGERNRPIEDTSFVHPSSSVHQLVVASTSSPISTVVSLSGAQLAINMANPVSIVRHNVFSGLGEDLDMHINYFNTMAQANNQVVDADKLRVFPATLDGYASD